MNYEQKYKEALETVQEILNSGADAIRIKRLKLRLQSVFPELLESNEDRIKREILELVSIAGNGNRYEEIKDWLEKQCEQKIDNSNTMFNACINVLRNVGHSHLADWLEKQGEDKPHGQRKECEDCQFNYADECKGYCTLKRNEHKPANNVELKFKVGNWVVRQDGENFCNGDYVTQITNITERGEHWFDSGSWLRAKDIRLWTINDAKDGDVLVASDGSIFLFAGIVDCACKYYVALESDNYIKINKEVEGGYWETSRAVHPATKEQRGLLFEKMKEAGYEWDAENKKVKKIEPLHIGEGLIKQIHEVHEYPPTTKENIRKALMSISTEEYEKIWKVAFGETYKEFVDKLLEN